MNCPVCKCPDTKVVDTRHHKTGRLTVRTRVCERGGCAHKFKTQEQECEPGFRLNPPDPVKEQMRRRKAQEREDRLRSILKFTFHKSRGRKWDRTWFIHNFREWYDANCFRCKYGRHHNGRPDTCHMESILVRVSFLEVWGESVPDQWVDHGDHAPICSCVEYPISAPALSG